MKRSSSPGQKLWYRDCWFLMPQKASGLQQCWLDKWTPKQSQSPILGFELVVSLANTQGFLPGEHQTPSWQDQSSRSCPCVCLVAQLYLTLHPHELQPARLLCPWDSPGENTGVGCHALLQEIFPTQGSNPGLPHCRQILYWLSHQGSPTLVALPVLTLAWYLVITVSRSLA